MVISSFRTEFLQPAREEVDLFQWMKCGPLCFLDSDEPVLALGSVCHTDGAKAYRNWPALFTMEDCWTLRV